MSNALRDFKPSPEVIRLAVRLYARFPPSLRSVEDLLHERTIKLSHKTVWDWRRRLGALMARRICKRRPRQLRRAAQRRWRFDAGVVKISGEAPYSWRAVHT